MSEKFADPFARLSAGLGLDACKHFARMGASRLVLGCRDLQKGEQGKQSILDETNCKDSTKILVWKVDMDDHASVRAFVERLNSKTELDRLDAVVANAGVELEQFSTSEGLERTLNVNVVSTFLLCLGVLARLSDTAQTDKIETHLTLIGSLIHNFGDDSQLHEVPAGENIYHALSDPKTAKMSNRYPLSKLMQHLCFSQLVAQVPQDALHGVVMTIVNPGWCGTGLSRNKNMSLGERFWFALIGRTSEEGSRTLVHAVNCGGETHGKYLSECQVKRQSTYVTSQEGQQMSRRLWQELTDMIGPMEI